MNSEVLANIIFKVLIALGSGAAGAAGISANCQQAVAAPLSVGLAGGLVALVSGIWSVYQHWGMKKVPVDAVILQDVPPMTAQARAPISSNRAPPSKSP